MCIYTALNSYATLAHGTGLYLLRSQVWAVQLDPQIIAWHENNKAVTRALGFPQNFPPGYSGKTLSSASHSEANSGGGADMGIGVPQQNPVCLGLSHLALSGACWDISSVF